MALSIFKLNPHTLSFSFMRPAALLWQVRTVEGVRAELNALNQVKQLQLQQLVC